MRLLAGLGKGGQAVYEQVPAAVVKSGVSDVLASPAMAYGCAAGDRIRHHSQAAVSDDARILVRSP